MATILPPNTGPDRQTARRAAENEQRMRPGTADVPATSHEEPSPREVMAEAMAIYPDTSPAVPTAEEIAAEAYAIYLGRGSEHGHDLEDWLEAERLLRRSRGDESQLKR